MKLSQSMEIAAQNMKELKAKPEGGGATNTEGSVTLLNPDVFRISDLPSWRTVSATCNHCGKPGHVVDRCKVSRDVLCHQCERPGHLRRTCKTGSQQRGSRVKKREEEIKTSLSSAGKRGV